MKKSIAILMILLMVFSLFTSCTTKSDISVPSQKAEVFDKEGNRIGYMEIPASTSVLSWKDWTKGMVMGSLITGAVGSLLGVVSIIIGSSQSKGPNYDDGYNGNYYN